HRPDPAAPPRGIPPHPTPAAAPRPPPPEPPRPPPVPPAAPPPGSSRGHGAGRRLSARKTAPPPVPPGRFPAGALAGNHQPTTHRGRSSRRRHRGHPVTPV